MRYLIISIIPLLILSCKKDVTEVNEITAATNGNEVYAGISDSTFDYYDYQPNLEVSITWDAQNLYGTGSDSIDLDLNGSFDLFITLNVLNYDSAYLLNGSLPNPFPSCGLSTSNEFLLAFYTTAYPIGMGQTSSVSYVDRMDFNERIDQLTDWRNSGKMWQENPGTIGTPPYGDWASAGNSNYIGIKKNNTLYGWIEINASDHYHPKFVRYVMQQ